jgi:hypothetical protein
MSGLAVGWARCGRASGGWMRLLCAHEREAR